MTVKTFPLHFTNEKLEEIGQAADKVKLPKCQFIEKAIDEKIARVNNKEGEK